MRYNNPEYGFHKNLLEWKGKSLPLILDHRKGTSDPGCISTPTVFSIEYARPEQQ